jgi:hypothetical protein
MAARKPREQWTPDVVRQRIRTAHIARVLQRHIFGQTEMSATQVRAAEILLRKTLPDQASMTHFGAIEISKPDELADSLLAHIATAGSAGAVEPEIRTPEPAEVH